MKRLIVIVMIAALAFSACKKSDTDVTPIPPTPEPEPESVLDYMPLAIGNYWIYETFGCDSGEINCVSKSIDTTIVTKDTLINGNTYFKLEGNYLLFGDPKFLTDSGDYLIDQTGTILFTNTDSVNTFNEQFIISIPGDTIYHFYDKLIHGEFDITVESGVFSCLDFRLSFYRGQDDFLIEHQGHGYYAKNVGLIKQSAFWASNLHVVKRELIGYHLND